MCYDHAINGLELVVAFLVVTNGISVAAAIGAVRLLIYFACQTREPTFVERKLELIFDRTA